MKMRARCVNGPFAGQTMEFPHPKNIHYPFAKAAVGPLMWINCGVDRHCYQLVPNGWWGDWRLEYRDTF